MITPVAFSGRQIRRLLLGTLAVGVVAAVRAGQTQRGLVYPDGYQYLLMARGIGQHARPLIQLGAGGDLFVPNLDASFKPLFPALVALVHWFGTDWLMAARAVSAAGAAATVVLVGLVGRKLTCSWIAGAVSGALCLLSPSLTYWSGFAGPDSLAPALGLAAVLLLLHGRNVLAGILVGACIATRPEYAAVATVAAMASVGFPCARAALAQASTSALLALALVLAVVRPPLAAPEGRVAIAAAAAAIVVAGLAALAVSDVLMPATWVGTVLSAVALVVHQSPGGLDSLMRSDFVPVALGVLGLIVCLLDGKLRRVALVVALAAVILGVIYAVKNPALERYFSQIVPLFALLAGLGLSRLRGRYSVLVAAAAVVLAATLVSPHPPASEDAFAAGATNIRATAGPIVTAAPDAYGFLLYPRTVRAMRPGERGVVVLDAAQRLFEPRLTAKGVVIRRIAATQGFLRPDGRIDRKPTILVRGTVVVRQTTARRPYSTSSPPDESSRLLTWRAARNSPDAG